MLSILINHNQQIPIVWDVNYISICKWSFSCNFSFLENFDSFKIPRISNRLQITFNVFMAIYTKWNLHQILVIFRWSLVGNCEQIFQIFLQTCLGRSRLVNGKSKRSMDLDHGGAWICMRKFLSEYVCVPRIGGGMLVWALAQVGPGPPPPPPTYTFDWTESFQSAWPIEIYKVPFLIEKLFLKKMLLKWAKWVCIEFLVVCDKCM